MSVHKDRILFWIDAQLIHFGIAKFLQEQHDCELFAIMDIKENSKEFFKNQNIVKFKKTWFYRDEVLDIKKPDIEYLKNIEKKYHVNLWDLVYSEKIFHKFNEYFQFKTNDILSILEQECKLFENILDEIKPICLIMKSADWHQNFLLHQMCASRDIQTLMMYNTRFGNRTTIDSDFDKMDMFENINEKNLEKKSIPELRDYIKKFSMSKKVGKFINNYRSSKWKNFKAGCKFAANKQTESYKKYYGNFGRTKLNIITNRLNFYFKRNSRWNFINRNFINSIDTSVPFIYFPLHGEPERSLNFDAPYYTNQVEVITNIAKSIPIEYKLFVKEHPVMNIHGWRPIETYKTLLKLPNVVLLHPSVSSEEIIKNSSLVITITGTTGLEASFFEKPTIVLTDTNYSYLPFIFRVKNMEDLAKTIRKCLSEKIDFSKLNEFVALIDKNSFEFDYLNLIEEFHNKFYYGGFLADVKISSSQLKSFFEEKKDIFNLLAQEHIKRIKKIHNEK